MKCIFPAAMLFLSSIIIIPLFPSGAAETDAVPRVTINYLSMNNDPGSRATEDKVLRMFAEEHPDVIVNRHIQDYRDLEGMTSEDPAAAAENYDLISFSAGYDLNRFIENGGAMHLSGLRDEEGWKESFPAGWINPGTGEGGPFFIPSAWYWWGIYYRPSVFKKYSLEVPETWNEFLDLCDELKSRGVTPLALGNQNQWAAAAWFDYLLMRTAGPEFHRNLMAGRESYRAPEVKRVFSEWAGLIDRGCFAGGSGSWYDAMESVKDESSGMVLMGSFIRDAFPPGLRDDLAFFRFPICDPTLPVGEIVPAMGYFIPAGTQKPKEAQELLAFLVSPDIRDFISRERGIPGPPGSPVVSEREIYNQKGSALISGADEFSQFFDRETHPELAVTGMDAFALFLENHRASDIDDLCDALERKRLELIREGSIQIAQNAE